MHDLIDYFAIASADHSVLPGDHVITRMKHFMRAGIHKYSDLSMLAVGRQRAHPPY